MEYFVQLVVKACQTSNWSHEDGKERGVWSTLATEEGTFWNVGERVVVIREEGYIDLYKWLDQRK